MSYPYHVNPFTTIALYAVTAAAEIVGCYAIYAWLRLGKPMWWLIPGSLSLFLFGYLLSFHPGPAGRIYAAYGAVYIASSLVWMWSVERHTPDRWDFIGAFVCLVGAAIIYFGPRT